MRALPLLALALAASAIAQPAGDRQRLADARREAAAAERRSARLAIAAAAERNAAARAAAAERALAARVTSAEADLHAAQARAVMIEGLLADQRARLAAAQTPTARLLAGLQSLAARPAIVALAQPGSVDDLVHLRAVLGGALPVVRARAAAVRADLERARRLQAQAKLARKALYDGRARLEGERVALARLEAEHRRRSAALRCGSLSESDRALAMGEQARDLIDRMSAAERGQVTAAALAALPGPIPRPLRPGGATQPRPRGPFRLPVAGRLVTGFGELSEAGVRSRGLALAAEPGAVVVAPAGGVVRYARRFRSYGGIVVIDHGTGWISTVTGMARLAVRPGQTVRTGAQIGAARGEDLPVTVEIRRHGRPVDAAALVTHR